MMHVYKRNRELAAKDTGLYMVSQSPFQTLMALNEAIYCLCVQQEVIDAEELGHLYDLQQMLRQMCKYQFSAMQDFIEAIEKGGQQQ